MSVVYVESSALLAWLFGESRADFALCRIHFEAELFELFLSSICFL